jgi:hypothetical protein
MVAFQPPTNVPTVRSSGRVVGLDFRHALFLQSLFLRSRCFVTRWGQLGKWSERNWLVREISGANSRRLLRSEIPIVRNADDVDAADRSGRAAAVDLQRQNALDDASRLFRVSLSQETHVAGQAIRDNRGGRRWSYPPLLEGRLPRERVRSQALFRARACEGAPSSRASPSQIPIH